jgi:uncharacterized protein (DUF1800 family)
MHLKRTTPLLVAAVIAAHIPAPRPSAAPLPDDEKTIVHVLNRIGFGARPGDVEKVKRIGLQNYIDQQLHPERIPDAEMSARLAHLTTVGMSSQEISRQFEQPLLEARRERRQLQANGNPSGSSQPRRMPVQQGANGVVVELSEQKLLSAIYSERQLQQVLTDFWFNHFNVDARKGRVRFFLTEYERDILRPHVLGSFRNLLGATAHSPAMLFYLDNWLSADPNGPHLPAARRPGRAVRRPQAPAPEAVRRRGLNENYARELMELHTLGVDGGYTQKDVTEVARAFTGWTIENPREGGNFRFDPRIHDDGEKMVLGRRIAANGGQNDGERVLDLLAAHPSTASFIATKLARRFVSDTPPPALVDRLTSRFTATNGDLRAVMNTLLTSPEFLAPEAYRAKVKSPLEFVVSAVRATGAVLEPADARLLVRSLQELGMPLYQCQPPTGYKDTADAWTNSGALVNRMNFAVSLASGERPAGRAREFRRATRNASSPDVSSWPGAIAAALAHDISATTQATLAKATTDRERVALALGSPEFQRR